MIAVISMPHSMLRRFSHHLLAGQQSITGRVEVSEDLSKIQFIRRRVGCCAPYDLHGLLYD